MAKGLRRGVRMVVSLGSGDCALDLCPESSFY